MRLRFRLLSGIRSTHKYIHARREAQSLLNYNNACWLAAGYSYNYFRAQATSPTYQLVFLGRSVCYADLTESLSQLHCQFLFVRLPILSSFQQIKSDAEPLVIRSAYIYLYIFSSLGAHSFCMSSR